MLVLTRKQNESIVIMLGDDNVKVTVLGIACDRVRIGVTAPRNITVHREEVADRIRQEGPRYGSSPNPPAAAPASPPTP